MVCCICTKKLAEMVKVPVALIGGVKKYEQVNFILNDSKIEYIVRALMKDPDLTKKWEDDEINKNK